MQQLQGGVAKVKEITQASRQTPKRTALPKKGQKVVRG
jgi:hypothetical protein